MKLSRGIIVLVFFGICVLGGLPICPTYSDKLNGDECSKSELKEDKMAFFVKKCKEDTYCHYKFPSVAEKCTKDPPKRYPGEYCKDENECLKNLKCTGHICTQENIGACDENMDCAIGYFCNNERRCQKLRINGTECSFDLPCDVNFACSGRYCVALGSVPKGKEADVPAACETFFIDTDGKCQEGYKLDSPKEQCTNEKPECLYKRKKDERRTPCSCGTTAEGKSYCGKGEGDIDFAPVSFY